MPSRERYESFSLPPLATDAVVLLGLATVAKLASHSEQAPAFVGRLAEVCGLAGAISAGLAIDEFVHVEVGDEYSPNLAQRAKSTIKLALNIRP